MAFNQSYDIPLLPLASDEVFFPGTRKSIPISNRPDLTVLLQSAIADPGLTQLGCVPLNPSSATENGSKSSEDAQEMDVGNGIDDQARNIRMVSAKLFPYGVIATIYGVQRESGSEMSLVVDCRARFRLDGLHALEPYLQARITLCDAEIPNPEDQKLQASFERLKVNVHKFIALNAMLKMLKGKQAISSLAVSRFSNSITRHNIGQASQLADTIANSFNGSLKEKLRLLESIDLGAKLDYLNHILESRLSKFGGRTELFSDLRGSTLVHANLPEFQQRLHEVLIRATPRVPGPPQSVYRPGRPEDMGDMSELGELQGRLETAQLSPEARTVATREMKRLQSLNPSQSEYAVCRTYLDTLIEIPWLKSTEDGLGPDTLTKARKQLDADHYGLEKIKKRLLEYLAVLKLKQTMNKEVDDQITELTGKFEELKKSKLPGSEAKKKEELVTRVDGMIQMLRKRKTVDKSPILLLQGPPGVGKTSLAKSVATSLGREFHRISLGGVRDEAEIRGHRRTYVAAMPGLIVSGLKKVGVCNPVFLLDEIDKVGASKFHGDPSAAMLEVLDPEQNNTFTDHYLNIPLDLSKVLFIATANSLDTIPAPLLDRMETITLTGYTTVEKRHIARQHLITKQIRSNGLGERLVKLPDDVIDAIATSYTREAGVRNLEREIGSVCRFKAVQYAEAKDSNLVSSYNPHVSLGELEEILGIERFVEEIAEEASQPGIVTGLVAYATGGQGSILFIEVADMPGTGRVQLTGTLGDVLKESVEVALSWVKAHAFHLSLTQNPNEDIMKHRSIHVHCPSGATPKDGPSAGLAHTIALVSLFSNKPVPPHIAMTGEMSLRGRIMPVGGIKEKLIGAHRAGVKSVLLPAQNRKDLNDVPVEVKTDLEIVCVSDIWEALKFVWQGEYGANVEMNGGIESRL